MQYSALLLSFPQRGPKHTENGTPEDETATNTHTTTILVKHLRREWEAWSGQEALFFHCHTEQRKCTP